jgi:hypothetical protein
MTLMKSMLLGSAAGIVAVAGAQAADLPTHKAAPVEYVKVCNVGGITGWVMPGTDTCMKISGYITAQFVFGNLNTQYNYGTYLSVANAVASTNPALATTLRTLAAASGNQGSQRILIAASDAQKNSTFYRPDTGWSMRANFGADFASNTAYGPLIGHFDFNGDVGNGLDALGGDVYVNTAYLTWAGITAGKAASFYSFTGGGDNWANFFSPDRKGFNEPILMAYTASFGGGFSATLSFESPGKVGGSGQGTQITGPGGVNDLGITYGGQRWPDIVGALHVKQGWGEAQVSGVLHDVTVANNAFEGANGIPVSLGGTGGCGIDAIGLGVACNARETKTGWGIDAGVKINLPSFGAGDDFLVTGSYTQSAVLYSGLIDGMWGEDGQTNGNGQPMALADAFFNPLTNQWSSPTAWSISALLEHHWTPQFYTMLEGSYGQLNWSNMGGGCYVLGFGCTLAQAVNGPLSKHATSWILGADLGWEPVVNLNFDLELMYQATTQDVPSGFIGTVYNSGGVGGAYFAPDWHGNSSGFAGRFRITRYF